MISFASESLVGNKFEMEPLMRDHWYEVTPDTKTFVLNFHWDLFSKLEDAGLVKMIVARHFPSGTMVGYVIFIIQPMLHYQHLKVAIEDAHYLMPDFRKGWTAIRMFRFAEKVLKGVGVDVVRYHTKVKLDKGPIFKRLGYEHLENLYTKRI